MGKVVIVDVIDDFLAGKRAAISQQIQNVKVERDILIGKTLSLERLVQGIMWDPSAVYREKHILTGSVLVEGHIVTEPTFDSPSLIIVAAGAFHAIFFTALEAIDIEFTHIVPDAVKALNQLAICQTVHLLWINIPYDALLLLSYHTCCPKERTAETDQQACTKHILDTFKRQMVSSQLFFRDFLLSRRYSRTMKSAYSNPKHMAFNHRRCFGEHQSPPK